MDWASVFCPIDPRYSAREGTTLASTVGVGAGRAIGSPVVLRLPEPMLARSDAIPSRRGWTFEPKLDGYRCLVCTHAEHRVL